MKIVKRICRKAKCAHFVDRGRNQPCDLATSWALLNAVFRPERCTSELEVPECCPYVVEMGVSQK
jgi:hypothetical protein